MTSFLKKIRFCKKPFDLAVLFASQQIVELEFEFGFQFAVH